MDEAEELGFAMSQRERDIALGLFPKVRQLSPIASWLALTFALGCWIGPTRS